MSYTLVYDTRCGPCTRFRKAVGMLDAGRRLDFVGLVEAERRGILGSVDPPRRHRSFHLVSPDGEVWSGSKAFPPLLALLPAGTIASLALSRCPPLSSAVAFTYAALSRLHETGSCGFTPGEGHERIVPDDRPDAPSINQ